MNNLEGFPTRTQFSMAELRGAMRTTVAELRALSAEATCAKARGGGVGDGTRQGTAGVGEDGDSKSNATRIENSQSWGE